MCMDDYIKELESLWNVHYAGEMDYEMVFNKYGYEISKGGWIPKYRIVMDVKNGKIQVHPFVDMTSPRIQPVYAEIDVREWDLYFKIMELAIDQLGQNEVKNS